jgi:hypothetical protein
MPTTTLTSRSKTALHELWHRWTQLALGYALAPPDPPAADRLKERIEEAFKKLEAGADHEAFVGWAKARVPWLAAKLGDAPPPSLPPVPKWAPPPTAAAKAVAERIVSAERKV